MADASSRAPLVMRALAWPLIVGVWAYRLTLSPLLGGQCRFEPTCSRYALDALRNHGAIHGARLTLIRLGRCHPLARGGYDPAPPPGEPPEPFRILPTNSDRDPADARRGSREPSTRKEPTTP